MFPPTPARLAAPSLEGSVNASGLEHLLEAQLSARHGFKPFAPFCTRCHSGPHQEQMSYKMDNGRKPLSSALSAKCLPPPSCNTPASCPSHKRGCSTLLRSKINSLPTSSGHPLAPCSPIITAWSTCPGHTAQRKQKNRGPRGLGASRWASQEGERASAHPIIPKHSPRLPPARSQAATQAPASRGGNLPRLFRCQWSCPNHTTVSRVSLTICSLFSPEEKLPACLTQLSCLELTFSN